MSVMKRILEKLFRLEPETCSNCDTLRLLLESERNERNNLVQALIEVSSPKKEQTTSAPENLEPIKASNYTPWRVRRQQLESEDRVKARILKQHKEDIEELEKKVGLDNATEEVSNGELQSPVTN